MGAFRFIAMLTVILLMTLVAPSSRAATADAPPATGSQKPAEAASKPLDASVFVPWLLTMVTAGVGIVQYRLTSARSNKVEFLKAQLTLCLEASNAVARVASVSDPNAWEDARATFWRLYLGPLSVVEDRKVEAAMVKLGNMIPRAPDKPKQIPMRELEGHAVALAHSVRNLILASWDIKLSPLAAGRTPNS